MTASLATFGYACNTLDVEWELQQVMCVNKRALIVDTRLSPWCRWSMLWQRDRLAARYGKHYQWRGQLLGNVNHDQPGKPIRLADEAAGIPLLCRWLEQDITLILLCACADYERCHRNVIYEKVKARLGECLPDFRLGQRVMTPNGAGRINPHVPLDVHRARNRYAVILDVSHPQRHYFPHELEPFDVVQSCLLEVA